VFAGVLSSLTWSVLPTMASFLDPLCRSLFPSAKDVAQCAMMGASRLVSTAIVALSFFLKIPQIMSILSAKSVLGLSFSMFLLELFAFAFQVVYSFRKSVPLLNYAETGVIMVQNFLIVMLIYRYTTGLNASFFAISVAWLSYLVAGIGGWTPMTVITSLQASTLALGTASKLPQIYTSFSLGTTGQLNAMMVFMQFGGCLARLATLIIDNVKDQLILVGYVVGALLNFILLSQIVYYRGSSGSSNASAAKKPSRKQE